uniref:Major facilitator superfamily (MFS) profile domain-containing protein n=1 Tax=Oryza glumipatula TaxID=40148 RepID=A0A0E0B9M6_9ORYZ
MGVVGVIGFLPTKLLKKPEAQMEASDEERPLIHHLPPQEQCSKYTCDGTVNIDSKPALKQSTGNWRACFFILGVEFTECICFYGVSKNLVTYLTSVLHESNVDAAQNVSIWIGSCFFTPLIGAFLADTYWGRYWTVVMSILVIILGMIVLTISASPLFLNASFYNGGISRLTVYLGLYLFALGTGGIKPNIPAFGADQFDDANPVERVTKGSFFNWYYFSINVGSLLSSTVVVWVQDNIGWSVGFAGPMLLLGFGLAVFIAGRRVYRYKKLGGSPLTRVLQVLVAAARNHRLNLPDDSSLLHELPGVSEGDYRTQHTNQFRFLDKAAILSDKNCTPAAPSSPWRLCTVSQVEELKMLLRTFPVWASLVGFFMVTAQMTSTLIEQGVAMDGRVGRFTVPPASLATFDVVAVLVLIPVYDAALVPLARRATGRDRGVSHTQRIGVGLALSAVAMAYSAMVEARRLAAAAAGSTPMSIVWQVPSFFVLGAGEVFAVIGMLEFCYEQSPASMKSLGTALVQLAVAVANYLNSGMLRVVAAATARGGGGGGAGWIPDKLDEGHLDYFFWMMAALSVLNLLQFLHCSIRFRGNNTLSS